MNDHYKKTRIEPIEIIDEYDLNFNLGNVIKYVLRSKYKHECQKEDLEKAVWYLNHEIKKYDHEKK